VDGKALDPGYKRLDWCRTHFVCSWSFKMADFPILPDDVLLMIVREYHLATVEDRALDGWWTVNAEMRQLPRCPKRMQIINVKGFYIRRFGNQLEPVTGYVWRRLITAVFVKNRDPRLYHYQWFRRVFGHDDYLCCTQLDML